MNPAQRDELFVKPFSIATAQIGHAANAQVHQIPSEARPDAGNPLKVFQRSGGW